MRTGTRKPTSSRPKKSAARKTRAANGTKSKQTKTDEGARDRPVAPVIWERAQAIAGAYQIVVEAEEGHWYGRGLELPQVFADGKTPQACVEATREALTVAAAYLLEQGQQPPARLGRRTQQVNVRLTTEEKALLEGTARRKGFEGLSDFMRAAALESAR